MLARLRENLGFKLLALIGAILLHYYVSNQQNPSQTRTIVIPVTSRNLQDVLLMANKPTVTVSLTGTPDELNRITDQNLTATVDLKRAHPGTYASLPVDVELSPAGIRSSVTVSDTSPRAITIQVAERHRRRMPITVIIAGTSPVGYSARRPAVVPSIANVVGPAGAVNSVARLVIKPDITGATDTVDDDFPIVPVDARGNDISDVRVSPDSAHAQIGIVETGRTKEVFVSPSVHGNPASGYIIGEVGTQPPTVVLTGKTESLEAINRIVTEPIDIQGVSKDIVKPVRCLPPANGATMSAQTVTVTIKIVPAGTPPALSPRRPRL